MERGVEGGGEQGYPGAHNPLRAPGLPQYCVVGRLEDWAHRK